MLRFQLINNQIGSLTIEKNDPIGINDLDLKIKRSAEHLGVFYEVMIDVEFIKEGRAFIKKCYEQAGGIDAIVKVNVYEHNPNTRRWSLYFVGQINFHRYILTETTAVVNIEQTGIERLVLNKLDVDVDLETTVAANGSALAAQAVQELTFHSKVITKETEGHPGDNAVHEETIRSFELPPTGNDVDLDMPYYGQISVGEKTTDELQDWNDLQYGFVGLRPTLGTGNEFNGWAVAAGAANESDYIDFLSVGHAKTVRNPYYTAREAGIMDVDIALRFKPSVHADNEGGDVDCVDDGAMGFLEVTAWYEHRNSLDVIKNIEMIGKWSTPGVGGNDRVGSFETHSIQKSGVDVEVGDKFYVYTVWRIFGGYECPEPLDPGGTGIVFHDFKLEPDAAVMKISLNSRTTFPESKVKGVLIHEAFDRCVQYHTNQVNCFYSELLGRTDLGYASDGDGALTLITPGKWIRGRYTLDPWVPSGESDSPNDFRLLASLKALLEFVKAEYCIGYGFETVDSEGKLPGTGVTSFTPGTVVFRVERVSHFFDKNTRATSLGRVYDIRRRVNPDMIYSQFEFGYPGKLDIKEVNAVDEFNALRRVELPIRNSKNKLTATTPMRTSGFQIEFQRRLRETTEDSNLDDALFAVSLVRDGESFKPKKDEGYEEIINVSGAETGYNYDFAPARMLENWKSILAASLVRSTNKVAKFSYGEMNYKMAARKTGEAELTSEDRNVDLSGVEPIWEPEIYEIPETALNSEQVAEIKSNRYGFIEFYDFNGNKFEGFISIGNGIDVDANRRKANIELLKVFRP